MVKAAAELRGLGAVDSAVLSSASDLTTDSKDPRNWFDQILPASPQQPQQKDEDFKLFNEINSLQASKALI